MEVSQRRPALTSAQVLAWADAHYARTGDWPSARTGPVAEAPGVTWLAIDQALLCGWRGLEGGSSLARLLARERGVRNRRGLPGLNVVQILTWAQMHLRRTGSWPDRDSDPVEGAPGESWGALDSALRDGTRGLPGGDSLARLRKR